LAESSDLYQQKDPYWLQRWEESLVEKNDLASYKQVYDKNMREFD